MLKTPYGAKFVFFLSVAAVVNIILLLITYDFSSKLGFYYNVFTSDNETNKRNWNDLNGIRGALNRTGVGEVGVPATLVEYQKLLYEQYGFDALLSDQISVNRSVPDVRVAQCLNMTHSARLPKTSIIIIFYNERRSVLLRTVYGILNRTPDELIEEIILVDDASTWADVLTPLDEYLRLRLPPESSKVRLIRLPVRRGLIVARMEGARSASKKSEAFVFLDSHLEVNYNWLPPLIDPIARNPKACTGPVVDRISFETFQYTTNYNYRGYFDWHLSYKMIPLNEEKNVLPNVNFPEYVLLGCAIAIGVDFFWDLGGFDEGMKLWGGEQYELSFKVWMCGGELTSVPCSRMGHLFRDPKTKGNINLYGNYSFIDYNFRRLVDVWMDEEHREYIFNHRPQMRNVDPGDIIERLSIRDRLQCKSFSWMMANIMPDMKTVFPPIELQDFGYGAVESMFQEGYCITLDEENEVVLVQCSTQNETYFNPKQYFRYTGHCELRQSENICLESDINSQRIRSFDCHRNGGNQKWFYDNVNHWIRQVEYDVCMVANVKYMRVDLDYCNNTNLKMHWILGYYNRTAINDCGKIIENSE